MLVLKFISATSVWNFVMKSWMKNSLIQKLLQKPIRAVFGGTHLVEADTQRIETTIDTLQKMGLEILGLSHCSGDAADAAICAKPEIQGCHLGVGDSVFFD